MHHAPSMMPLPKLKTRLKLDYKRNLPYRAEKKFCRMKEPSGHVTGCKPFHRLKEKEIERTMGIEILTLINNS